MFEQTSWVLFLKYLDDLERDRATTAELTGKTYTTIIDAAYQWNHWAALANPPFGGKERAEVLPRWSIKPFQGYEAQP